MASEAVGIPRRQNRLTDKAPVDGVLEVFVFLVESGAGESEASSESGYERGV